MRPIMYVMLVCILVLTPGFEISPAAAQPKLAGDPAIVSISPASFASGVNQPVTISGTDLSNVTSALLGDTLLRNLQVINATQVTALVPWSIAAGTYDLTVKSQAGPDAVLPAAMTVSAADTDWVSNGPFGGDLYNVVLDPVDNSRLYVAAQFSGLFKSHDSGANWDMALLNDWLSRTQISYPTPGQPPVIYSGIRRSLDYGQTWQEKAPPGYFGGWNTPGNKNYFTFVRPDQPNWVYLAFNSNPYGPNPDVGVYVSQDQGESWSRLEGTAGLHATALAFDPDDHNRILLGTANGNVYTSSDNGSTWGLPVKVANYIGRLVFAPTQYAGKRSLWVIGCFRNCSGDNQVYRSNDGGLNWSTVNVVSGQDNHGISYHDTIPGLLWSAVGSGYFSTDNGDTWTALSPGIQHVTDFAIVPGGLSRQTTSLFAGSDSGLYNSSDGGDTWVESDHGLGAELAGTIAISPFNADEAYTATQAKGLQHSFDGGRSWQSLSIPISGSGAAIAPDPFTDGKVYFGNGANSGLPPTVRVSSDHGSSFSEYGLTLPSPYAGYNADVLAIAPDPQIPNRLLAGVCLGTGSPTIPASPGLVYASTDGGHTWAQQAAPAGTTCISLLAIDPQDPDVVYAGSISSGFLRSTDRGATWALLAHQPTTARALSLDVDPSDSNSIYLSAYDQSGGDGGGIFATHDGGDTWVKMTGGSGGAPVWALKFVKVGESYWLYAATYGGLRYLKTIPDDPTAPWDSASGIAGVAPVTGFNAATEDGRVVYYVGTSGGTVYNPSGSSRGPAAAAGSQLMPGGIYRSMIPASQFDIPPAPGWQMRDRSGSSITALEVFNGQLYAAHSNWGPGARVWRLNEDNHWAPVSEVGMSATYGSTNWAILDLATFKGKLYASLGWGSNESQIWRTDDGTNWTKVTDTEFSAPSNRQVNVLTVFGDYLYAGAGGDVEIWRSSNGDIGSWERVAQDGLGNPNNGSMTGAATYNGTLYVSLSNIVDGATIYRTTNGTEWTQVNTSGFGDVHNSGDAGMAVLGRYLYVGTKNTTTGGQVWRYDGTNWTQVVGGGFGNINNIKIESLYSVQSWLFAVTTNLATGLQVWRTANGTDWTSLNLDGFGNINNNDVLWSNSSTAFEHTFFVGTWNGEIWQYVGSYGVNLYLPLIRR